MTSLQINWLCVGSVNCAKSVIGDYLQKKKKINIITYENPTEECAAKLCDGFN